MKTPARPERIVGIDICRSAAIIAAMASHAMVTSGAFIHNPTDKMTVLRFFFQMAPPIFIGLFGAMIEIAYRPKFEKGDSERGIQQLLSRALQCYLLYALCMVFSALTGDFSAGYALRCLLLMGVTPFVDILKFYAVVLVLAPLFITLSLKARHGLLMLVLASVVIHLSHPYLMRLPPLPQIFGDDYLSFPAGFLYGGAVGPGGPSVLHGLGFVFLGMFLGRMAPRLLGQDHGVRTRARLAMAGIVILTGLTTALMWNWREPFQTATAIADLSLRNDNHPLYFSLGGLTVTLVTWAALEIYDRLGFRLGRGLTFISSTSLFTFSFGNMFLLAAPQLKVGPFGSVIYASALLSLVLLLSWSFKRILSVGLADERARKRTLWARLYSVQSMIVRSLGRAASGPAHAYALVLSPRHPGPIERSLHR